MKSRLVRQSRFAQRNTLEIRNLHVTVAGQEILKGINLTIKSGEIHAVMGPNGSGKSTLCNVLMGHPKYEVTDGEALLNGKNILEMEPHQRAHLGLFLGFQHPLEVAGVSLGNFLRLAKNAVLKAAVSKANEGFPHSNKLNLFSLTDFMKLLKEKSANLKMADNFITRSVNEGFSGGERKRAEIVQMAVLEPKIALLDEIDSGLDIDALKTVAKAIKETFEKTNAGILLVTHYQRILNYIAPHFVHIISQGKIVKSAGPELAGELEEKGYEKLVHTKSTPPQATLLPHVQPSQIAPLNP